MKNLDLREKTAVTARGKEVINGIVGAVCWITVRRRATANRHPSAGGVAIAHCRLRTLRRGSLSATARARATECVKHVAHLCGQCRVR